MDHQWLEPHGGGGRAGDGGGPAEGQLTVLPEAGPQVSPAPPPHRNPGHLGAVGRPLPGSPSQRLPAAASGACGSGWPGRARPMSAT